MADSEGGRARVQLMVAVVGERESTSNEKLSSSNAAGKKVFIYIITSTGSLNAQR